MPAIRLVVTSLRDRARSPGRWGAMLVAALVSAALAFSACAQSTEDNLDLYKSSTLWLMVTDGGLWCGFTDEAEARAEAAKSKATYPGAWRLARVTFGDGAANVTTLRFEPESRNWTVTDSYRWGTDYLSITRQIRMKELGGLVIEQHTAVSADGADTFPGTRFTMLDGEAPPADLTKVHVPWAPAWPYPSKAPFSILSDEMNRQGLSRLCKDL